jgi:hypothetical protein
MNWKLWVFLCSIGSVLFLMLSPADHHTKTGADGLSKLRVAPHWLLQADPDLRVVSERSPYMRTER